ncbi:MAG: septum formation initiator family protein [Alloprevotella sp.]|nr:septum formation initiator family protein [Alloprevotella sp.]MBR1652081.1 septum formation initiator family protein [Alloprevotella sp.]
MGKRLNNLGRSFLRHKTFWTIVLFVVYAGFLDPNSLMERYRLHSENTARQAEIASLDARYARGQARLNELGTSREAIESVARVSLKMKTDNEDLYIIEEE